MSLLKVVCIPRNSPHKQGNVKVVKAKTLHTKVKMEQEEIGRLHPFEILPEEMWILVWKQINDPVTRLLLMRTHKSFNELFKYGKANWLFPAVLPHVIPYLEQYLTNSQRSRSRQGGKLMLNLRKVSVGSCKAVDDYVEKIWERDCFTPMDVLSLEKDLLTRKQIQNFLRRFESHPRSRNPLISRCLRLWVIGTGGPQNRQNVKPSLGNILDIVRRLGPHLRGLWIAINVNDGEQFSKFLKLVLNATPNLRQIRLSMFEGEVGRALEIFPEELEGEDMGMPHLLNLEDVEFIGPATPKLIGHIDFRQYFSQLRILKMNYAFLKQQIEGLDIPRERIFPKLTKFLVTLDRNNVPFEERGRLCKEASQMVNSLKIRDIPKVYFDITRRNNRAGNANGGRMEFEAYNVECSFFNMSLCFIFQLICAIFLVAAWIYKHLTR